MHIKIAQRFVPYSRQLKTKCLIPRTYETAIIYPARIELLGKVIALPFTGPFRNFQVELDLEKGKIFIKGEGKEGFFRYVLFAEKGSVYFRSLKSSLDIKPKQFSLQTVDLSSQERLFLGKTKKQEITQIYKRRDLEEMLPLIHRLSLFYPEKASFDHVKEFQETVFDAVEGLFHFSQDPFYQNLSLKNPKKVLESASFIRSLFFTSDGDSLTFSNAPFAAGKLTDAPFPCGLLDLEWTKKKVRRVRLKFHQDTSLYLRFDPKIKTFRLNKKTFSNGSKLTFVKEKLYDLDRFEK